MNGHRTLNVSLAALAVVVLIAVLVGLSSHERRVEARAEGHLKTMLMLRTSVLQKQGA